MRPDFRLSLLGLEGSRRSGWHQFALQTKLAKYAPKPREATLHCNRGQLRTLLPRFRTTKTRRRPPISCVLVTPEPTSSFVLMSGQPLCAHPGSDALDDLVDTELGRVNCLDAPTR